MCSIQNLYTYATYNRSSTGCSCYNTAAVRCGSHLPYLQFGYCMTYDNATWATEYGLCLYTKRQASSDGSVAHWLVMHACYQMCAPVNSFIWSLSVIVRYYIVGITFWTACNKRLHVSSTKNHNTASSSTCYREVYMETMHMKKMADL